MISDLLQSRIDAGDFPSAVYLVGEKGEIRSRGALGLAVVEPEKIEARFDTIYDLASLTKPLVTALLIAKLVETGKLDPNGRLGDLLNEFYTSPHAEVTINQLMMHTSGLPAWRPLYLLADSPELVIDEIARTLPDADQQSATYSDLNFVTLAAVIERVTGSDLSTLVSIAIANPLGLASIRFNPPKDWRPRIAASEKGNRYEKQTCIDAGYISEEAAEASDKIGDQRPRFRDHILWGEVHDGNAHFMGGVAGHAGLFGTAEDVFKIALQFLPDHTRLLKPETCQLFRTNFTRGLNEDRSFGFQLASTEGSTAGSRMPPESFGHNGFTGTSLWIDPDNDRVFVLLTNRTHHHAPPFVNINSVRRRFHDLAIETLDESSEGSTNDE